MNDFQKDYEGLVEQAQTIFIDRLIDVNLIDPDDNTTKGVVALFLRSYTQDIIDVFKMMIDKYLVEASISDIKRASSQEVQQDASNSRTD